MDIYPPAHHLDASHFFEAGLRQQDLFQHKVLTKPMFDYIVQHVKLPLNKALIAKRTIFGLVCIIWNAYLFAYKIKKHIGEVTKENTIYISTHNLIEEKEDFFKHHHNKHNDRMLDTVYDIGIAVTGHDPYYEWLYRRHCWEIVKQYLSGRLPPLETPPKDLGKCWKE